MPFSVVNFLALLKSSSLLIPTILKPRALNLSYADFKRRDFRYTGNAPCGPEIHQDVFPFEFRDCSVAFIEIRECEIRNLFA